LQEEVMAAALIVYGSTTGNTQRVAEDIAAALFKKGLAVTMKNVSDVRVDELGGSYDLTLLGSSTWGEEEIEFQEDFGEFYPQLDKAELEGKKVALFGCGDSSDTHFCGAVDLLEEAVERQGGELVVDSLRVDGEPADNAAEILDWAERVAAAV
jgi:flavodoxin I